MLRTLFTATLFGLLTIGAASAQNRSTLEAQIPFDFTVGHQAMNAGLYRIVFNPSSSMLTVQGRDAHSTTAFTLASPGGNSTASGTGKLVFDCGGGACSLAKVLPAADSGRDLQVSQPSRRVQMVMQTRVVPILRAAQ